MILFYSNSCQHCSILLDTIKKHDTKKTIKLVCVDTKIGFVKHKITNVPALMFLPTKEIIYGKAVFDYLLLPNRGYLFTSNSTREKPQNTNNENSSINSPIPLNTEEKPDEPSAFSLGSILTDHFSNITDDNINSMSINNDKLYKWDFIDGSPNSSPPPPPPPTQTNEKNNSSENRKLPSLEELTKEREKLFKDIK
jgi:hypothetical protein